ncbi:MAG: hypothetical protein ACTTKX_02100 [Treponema sp.]
MERLNIGSKPYNKSSKNTQNRLTHTKPRSQSFANSEQRTANSEQRTANSEQRTALGALRAHISSRNTITALIPTAQELALRAFFYCQVKKHTLKDLVYFRPPVICHSKSRIKTLEIKPHLRCPAWGFLGDGGRDNLVLQI